MHRAKHITIIIGILGLARYIGSSKFFEMPIYLASYKATGVFRDYEWCFVGATGELYLSFA